MDRNDTPFPARHYRDRMAETGCSKHRPKICLGAIKAARHYQEMLAALGAARADLVELAVRRAADQRSALAALNHLADSFGLPAFNMTDIAATGPSEP
jgi:hypothetical protein